MKISSHRVPAVLHDPAPYIGILFYGDDMGRMRDYVSAATRAVLGASADPFRSTVLTREEHTRLRDEMSSLALGGGRRVIRVQDATDGLAAVLNGLSDHRADALVLLEAATLTPRSKLRTMAEKHPSWAVIGCYSESGASLANEIKRTLAVAGLAAEASALAYLTQELAGESAQRQGELEKLCLFAAGADVISLETAQACCSIGLDATLGLAVSAALSGQMKRCDDLMAELAREGASGPGVLAVMSNEVQRLLKVRLLMEEGRSMEDAARSLQPPVFPRQLPGFMQAVQRWTVARLEALGRVIRDADMACKRAASPDVAIAGHVLRAAAARATQA